MTINKLDIGIMVTLILVMVISVFAESYFNANKK